MVSFDIYWHRLQQSDYTAQQHSPGQTHKAKTSCLFTRLMSGTSWHIQYSNGGLKERDGDDADTFTHFQSTQSGCRKNGCSTYVFSQRMHAAAHTDSPILSLPNAQDTFFFSITCLRPKMGGGQGWMADHTHTAFALRGTPCHWSVPGLERVLFISKLKQKCHVMLIMFCFLGWNQVLEWNLLKTPPLLSL